MNINNRPIKIFFTRPRGTYKGERYVQRSELRSRDVLEVSSLLKKGHKFNEYFANVPYKCMREVLYFDILMRESSVFLSILSLVQMWMQCIIDKRAKTY